MDGLHCGARNEAAPSNHAPHSLDEGRMGQTRTSLGQGVYGSAPENSRGLAGEVWLGTVNPEAARSHHLELGQILGIDQTYRPLLGINDDQIVDVPLIKDPKRFHRERLS
jgi:hypothetical protein